MNLCVKIGARGSHLSKKQVDEVLQELQHFHPDVTFSPLWVTTKGDKDHKTSLRELEKSNFFTKEIDEQQLQGVFSISIHSAKDLPDPLPAGLVVACITKGLDPADSLVMSPNFTGKKKIATSSIRREEIVKKLYPEAEIVDIRGTIEERLRHLEQGEIEGLVVAECALIRLGLTDLARITLDGPVAEGQGQLAVVARKEDKEMLELFSCIDSRTKKRTKEIEFLITNIL